MGKITDEDVLNTLKKLNIDTYNKASASFSWLLEQNEIYDIFNWLCTYISADNINISNEIYECAKYYQVSDDDFEEKVLEVNTAYPGIFEIDACQVNSFKKKVENAQAKEIFFNELTCQYLSLDYKIGNQISKLTETELNTKVMRQALINECLQKSKKIDELHGELYNLSLKHQNIIINFNNINTEKYFLTQLSLSEFKQYCHSFNTNIHLWIEKHIPNIAAEVSRDYVDNELHRLKYEIQDITIKNINAECINKELITRLGSRYTVFESLDEHFRVEEIETMSRVTFLTEENRLLLQELNEVVEVNTEGLINDILYKNAVVKLNKCKDMLNLLKGLHSAVLYALAQHNFLCLLLQIDKCKIDSLRKYLKESLSYISKYQKQYLLRYKVMNKARKEATILFNKENKLLDQILLLITNSYEKSAISVKDALAQLKNQRISIETLENKLFSYENEEYFYDTTSMVTELHNIKEFIYSGPVLQAEVIPYKFLELQADIEVLEDRVDKKLKFTFDSYKRTKSKLKKNRWLEFRCLLWAWFLTDPEKIVTTINQLQEHIIKQSTRNMQ